MIFFVNFGGLTFQPNSIEKGLTSEVLQLRLTCVLVASNLTLLAPPSLYDRPISILKCRAYWKNWPLSYNPRSHMGIMPRCRLTQYLMHILFVSKQQDMADGSCTLAWFIVPYFLFSSPSHHSCLSPKSRLAPADVAVNCNSKEEKGERELGVEPQVFGVCSRPPYSFLLRQVSALRGRWVFINTLLTIVELFQGQGGNS